MAPYLMEQRGRFSGGALAVVRPSTAEQVAAVVTAARQAGVQIVPQGGNTGLVGASMSYPGERAIVLSLQRMNRIRELDPLDYSATVEAGCILANVQKAAEDADRLFPLSLGSEGSCTIGGLLSTNAGGTMTIRYGNMRELILGIEAVLPDGRIWNGLRRLHKNNTGYDLKHLFIGGEGTLGIVTAAVLKLFPRPRQVETAFVAVPEVKAAIELLARLRAATGDALSGFELIPRMLMDFALKHIAGVSRSPALNPSLVCAGRGDRRDRGRHAAEFDRTGAGHGDGGRAGAGRDARRQRNAAQRLLVHPRGDRPIAEIRGRLDQARYFSAGQPGGGFHCQGQRRGEGGDARRPSGAVRPCRRRQYPFQPDPAGGRRPEEYMAEWERMNHIVHRVALDLGGSISAEHGIGRFKRDEMRQVKSAPELDMMLAIKAALDPEGLMNPHALLPGPSGDDPK